MYSNSRSLTVGEIMSFPVITGSENDSVKSIAAKMKKHEISGVVIVGKDRIPLGMVTAGDIVRRVVVRSGPFLFSKAKHVMSKPVHTITRERPLEEAARTMADKKVKNLCVVDGSNKLIGIITEEDITKNASYLIDVLNEMVRIGYTKSPGTVGDISE